MVMEIITENKIPKTIHYCWFGKKPLPQNVLDCIASWKKYLPNYKIIEWNEDNFNINSNLYVKQAYESHKYAFVTDYIRLYALYHYGGVYMDTDVEIVRNIDEFLIHSAFSGFESEEYIPTAIMGAQKKNIWIEKLLDYYNNKHFIKGDGTLDTTTNVSIITEISINYFNVKLNNQYQDINGILTLFPKEYFCPKSYKTGLINQTENTYAIHHFSGSWLDEKSQKNRLNNYYLVKVFGEKIGRVMITTKDIFKKKGLVYLLKIIASKLRN
jgi:mannosyltransferase OCH1-like enzyme